MANRNVYNLSPDIIDTIDNQEDGEYKIYEEALDAALKKRNIRNIAVTGNFGIGKSRFLHYYSNKNKRKFLFVSGCSFMKPGKLKGKDGMEQVEYNLIYQLLLGCHRYAGSGILRGMPLNQLHFLRILGSITGLPLLCAVFLLTLAPKFEPYFRELRWYNSANIIVPRAVCVALIIILLIDICALSVTFWNGRHRLNLKSVSLEWGSAKFSIENQDGTSYFYQNRYALLSSLVDAADQIGHTVVFEDMDRLEGAGSLSLFTELWELNQEVNLYIGEGEPIRFIYVLHDQLFSPEGTEDSVASTAPDAHIQLKFFDYILPIIPKMGPQYAVIVAKSLLKKDSDFDEILTEVAPYLTDYRLLRTIANEYDVFSSVEKARREVLEKRGEYGIFSALAIFLGIKEQDNGKEYIPTKDEKVKLLGLVIYKNLMPQDYKKIRENSSKVLPTVSEMDRIPRAVQILLDRKWLDASCLHFVYNWASLQKHIKGIFRQGKESAVSKKYWLEHEFDLCCEIDGFDPNLEGVEFTFADMTVRSKKKTGISILKKYKGSPAVEICSKEQLEQIHLCLGLSGKESVFNDEEKLTVLYFLSRMGCHILWKIIPDIPDGLDTTESIWWNLFCQIDKEAFTCLVKCCEPKSNDPIGQENYLADWITRSSIFKNTNWEEGLPQDSYEIKEFIKQRLAVPIS